MTSPDYSPLDDLWMTLFTMDSQVHSAPDVSEHKHGEVITLSYLNRNGNMVVQELYYHPDELTGIELPCIETQVIGKLCTQREVYALEDDYSATHLNHRGISSLKAIEGVSQMARRAANMLTMMTDKSDNVDWAVGTRVNRWRD